MDELVTEKQLPWRRTGDSIEVMLGTSERKQVVHLEERGEFYVLWSIVQRRPGQASPRHLRDLAYRCWRRNARTALVTFAMEPERLLRARHPDPLAFEASEDGSFLILS